MKYLMGLMMTFAIGATSFAQTNDNEMQSRKSKCSKATSPQGSSSSQQGNLQQGSLKTIEVEPGVDKTCGYGSGSVEYSLDPSAKNTSSGATSNEAAKSEEMVRPEEEKPSANLDVTGDTSAMLIQPSEQAIEYSTSDVASMGTSPLGTTCRLNNELSSREGHFKDKKTIGNGELKMEREKDGEEKLQYKSDNEFYSYQKSESGKEEFVHDLQKGSEIIELRKNKDGSADIMYQGHFNSLDDAEQAINEGLVFEDVASACSNQ